MTSGGETPGIGGYPDLKKPEVRVTQAYRMLWTQLLVKNKQQAIRAQQAINGVHAITRKRKR